MAARAPEGALVRRLAPAKINLCLHVTAQRGDGYHLLDSLVVFADLGDWISVGPAQDLSLQISGPFAAGLVADDPDNLVLRAARAFGGAGRGARIALEKNLPIASGIGGGSADAAATLMALAQLWDCALPPASSILALGADVPACLAGQPCRMQGIGEVILPLAPLAPLWLVLVNPGIAVSTPGIFKALTRRQNPGLPAQLGRLDSAGALLALLQSARNDLQDTAITLAPVIGEAIAALAMAEGCQLARMSGSGATCFGLFLAEAPARAAASALAGRHPGWWVAAAPVLAPPA